MKPFACVVLICLFTGACFGQTNINADCINAIPLCSTPNFTFNATSGVGAVADIPGVGTISNPSINPVSGNAGCLLSGELKPQWLLITVGNAGNLEFVFGAGGSAHPQAGFYDWAMWPYTPATCANIQNNTLPPIRCNWNASSSGGTGIASAANQPPNSSSGNFEPPLPVLPCQQFIICISNYSGVNTLVSFQSLGTASLTCNPSCINVNNPVLCAGSTSSIVASSSGNLSNIVYSINPGGQTSPTPTFVISPTVNTTYTIYATGINASSVAVTQTAVSNATVNPQPNVAPTVTQATCFSSANGFNLGLTFFPSAATPSYMVSWATQPAGIITPQQTSLTGTIMAGGYAATITAAGGCYTVASFTINAIPAPPVITFTPSGPSYILTCRDPVLTINSNPANSYTWNALNSPPINSDLAVLTYSNAGTWTVIAQNTVSGCMDSRTLSVSVNTVTPVSAISPTFQIVNCSLSSISSLTASASPSVNINHIITSPQGATYSTNAASLIYPIGGPGTYTHCVIDAINGCSSCKQFTVQSSQGYPTFSLSSSPPNFTLGCNSKSLTTINILAASATSVNPTTGLQVPTGGPVTYTVLSPSASTVLAPNGSLNGSPTWSVFTPGTWTVVVRDNNNFCETRVPVSVVTNTNGPHMDTLIIPQRILDCNTPSVTLEAISQTPNIGFVWSYTSGVGQVPASSVVVSTQSNSPSSATLIANYSLTITNNNNTCVTTTVVPMYQNLFAPIAAVSAGEPALSCKVFSITLTSQCSSRTPTGSIFPPGIAVASLWKGPSPQPTVSYATTYNALTVGDYTMIAKDITNGCTSSTVIPIGDNRLYPSVNTPTPPAASVLDCGSKTASVFPVISDGLSNLSYSWIAVPEAHISDPSQRILFTDKIGIYRVIVTNTINGCASVGELKVVNGSLTASLTADGESGFAPYRVGFTNLSASTTGSTGIVSVWDFGNGTNSVTASASISPSALFNYPGTYKVTMRIVKGVCSDTASRTIRVDIPSQLTVPNIFTPNGDGVNDVFFLRSASIEELSIRVYDRWGHKVYELSSGLGNIAWDGKNQLGVECADGIYFYVLKAVGKDGKWFEQKGNITLTR